MILTETKFVDYECFDTRFRLPLQVEARMELAKSYWRLTALIIFFTGYLITLRYQIFLGGCRVQGAGFWVQGSGCRMEGAGCRVQGAGCRVQGAGLSLARIGATTRAGKHVSPMLPREHRICKPVRKADDAREPFF